MKTSSIRYAAMTALLFLSQTEICRAQQILQWTDGTDRTTFGANEAITIGFGRIGFIQNCQEGVDDFLFPFADIYIYPIIPNSQAQQLELGSALEDVNSGAHNSISALSSGAFVEEIIGFTKPGGAIGSGSYAVIYDECQDGIFGEEDTLFPFAFDVVLPAVVPSIGEVEIHLLKERALGQAEEWNDHAKGSAHFFAAAEIASFIRIAFSPRRAISAMLAILKKGPSLLSGGGAQVQVIKNLTSVERNYRSISKDPPDPDFISLVTLGPRPLVDTLGNNDVDIAFAALNTAISNESQILLALLFALEKYQGAQQVGNGEWALAQARAIRHYVDLLSAQLQRTTGALQALDAALASDPRDLEGLARDLSALRARILSTGLSDDELRELANSQLSVFEIDQVVSMLIETDFSLFDLTALRGSLVDLQNGNASLAADLAVLSTELDSLVQALTSDPSIPDRFPTADPGGPYSGSAGDMLVFDGTGSMGISELTRFHWDLSGDGSFDDADGPVVSFAYDRAVQGYVGLKVTDARGFSDIAYVTLDVTDLNQGPVLLSAWPADRLPETIIEQPTTFSIDVSDPDGDPLAVEWFIDGEAAGDGFSLSFTPSAADLGIRVIEAIATDDRSAGKVAARWAAVVLFPDVDEDLWHANLDCDDHDPEVGPQQAEIPGNGKDDDCNPLTPDLIGEIVIDPQFTIEVLAVIDRPTSLALSPPGGAFDEGLFVGFGDPFSSTQSEDDRIYLISPSGEVSPFALLVPEADPISLEFPPVDSAFGTDLYVSANNRDFGKPGDCGGVIQRVDPLGNVTDFTSLQGCVTAGLGEPRGLAFGPGGDFGTDLFVANSSDFPADIVRVDPLAALSIALDDGQFTPSGMRPTALAFGTGEGFGNDLYFTDETCNCIRTVDPNGEPTLFVTLPATPTGARFGPGGAFGTDLYTVADGTIYRVQPDASFTAFASGFNGGLLFLDSLEFERDATALYVADFLASRVYVIRPRGSDSSPRIEVVPTAVDYSELVLGTTRTETVLVTNTGGLDLEIIAIEIDGLNADHFLLEDIAFPMTLEPGQSQAIGVTFNPFVRGLKTAKLRLRTEATDSGIFDVPLSGTGLVTPDGRIAPITHDYGNLGVDGERFQTFVVRNDGSADLEISGITLDGPDPEEFIIQNSVLTFTLAPGSSRAVVVSFRPQAEGPKSSELRILSVDQPELRATLLGNGIDTLPVADAGSVADGDPRTPPGPPFEPYTCLLGESTLLDATGSFDAAGQITAFAWAGFGEDLQDTTAPQIPFVCASFVGDSAVSLIVTDESGVFGFDDATIRIGVDAGEDLTLQCGEEATLGTHLPDRPQLSYRWTNSAGEVLATTPVVTLDSLGEERNIFPGGNVLTLKVTDQRGTSRSDTVLVTVADSVPAAIVFAEPTVLWPPNHRYSVIELDDVILSITDACGSALLTEAATIASVTSDEQENGSGDGNTLHDIVISADCRTAELRAERRGGGNGRVYTIEVETTDDTGQTITGIYQVQVPHDRSGGAAIDDGPIYRVNGCGLPPVSAHARLQ